MKKIWISLFILCVSNHITFAQKKAKPAKPVTHRSSGVSPVKKVAVNQMPATSAPIVKKNIPVEIPVTVSLRELEMIKEINTFRANPPAYAVFIRKYLEGINPDKNQRMAADELFKQLKKLKPLSPLSVNLTMYKEAREFGMYMVKNNIFEHSNLPYNENLSLGYSNIRDAICDLLIDDNVDDRGHRKNLLSDKINYIAVYECPGKVQDIEYCYVQVFK